MGKQLYPKVSKTKDTSHRRWKVDYNLTYDYYTDEFTLYYNKYLWMRLCVFYNVKIASWGGSAILTDQKKGVIMYQINQIAKACHEMNRVIQFVLNEKSAPSWEDSSDEVRASAVEGVKKAIAGQTPEQLHESWMEFKISQGWKYGLEKSERRKKHPCIVPYEELPEAQKYKDRAFKLMVQAMTEPSKI